MYHICFFGGYLYAIKSTKQIIYPNVLIGNKISKNSIKIVMFFAIIASFMGMKQFAFQQLINPSVLYNSVLAGLINPGEQYTLKMVSVSLNNTGDKIFNILLFFTLFYKCLV